MTHPKSILLPSKSDITWQYQHHELEYDFIRYEVEEFFELFPTKPVITPAKESDEPPKKKARKKEVSFTDVTIYYFKRAQGFTSVPATGGSTLGMEKIHFDVEVLSTFEHAEQQRKQREKDPKYALKLPKFRRIKYPSPYASEDDGCDDFTPKVQTCYVLQPISLSQRRTILRDCGIRIKVSEYKECRAIRFSRKVVGCRCKDICEPLKCSCNKKGIECQINQDSYPCGCCLDGCGNSFGVINYDPEAIREHHALTLVRTRLEETVERQMEGRKQMSKRMKILLRKPVLEKVLRRIAENYEDNEEQECMCCGSKFVTNKSCILSATTSSSNIVFSAICEEKDFQE